MNKRTFFSLFLMLFLIPAFSKESNDSLDSEKLFNAGKDFYNAHEFQKAFDNFSRAADANHLEAAYFSGFCLENGIGVSQSYTQAASYYKKAAKQNHEKSILALGKLYKDGNGVEQDFSQSLECFSKVLEKEKNEQGEYCDEVKEVYLLVADVYAKSEDFDKSISYYEKALEISKKLHGEENPDYYEIYKNVAFVYLAQNDIENALNFFSKTINLAERKSYANENEKAELYDSVGKIYESQKNYSAALENYEAALALYEMKTNSENSNEDENYENTTSKNYKEKKKNNQTIKVLSDVEKEFYPKIANEHKNIAQIYFYEEIENLEKIHILNENAMKIVEFRIKNKGKKTSRRQKILDEEKIPDERNLPLIEKSFYNVKKALDLLDEIPDSYATTDVNIKKAESLSLLARILYETENFSESLEIYKILLELTKSIYGENHTETAIVYSNISVIYWQKLKDYKNARIALRKTLSIYSGIERDSTFGNIPDSLENLWELFVNWQSPLKVSKSVQKEFEDLRESTLKTALSIARKIRDMKLPQDDKNFLSEKVLPFYYLAVNFYSYDEPNDEETLRYAELIKTEGFLQSIGQKSMLNVPGLSENDRKVIAERNNSIRQYTKSIFQKMSLPLDKIDYESVNAMRGKAFNYEMEVQSREKALRDKSDRTGNEDILKYFSHKEIRPVDTDIVSFYFYPGRVVLEYVLWNKNYEDALVQPKNSVKLLSLGDAAQNNYQDKVLYNRSKASRKTEKRRKFIEPKIPGNPEKYEIKSWCVIISSTGIKSVQIADNFEFENELTEFRKIIIKRTKSNDNDFAKYKKFLYSKLIEPIKRYLPPEGKDLLIIPDGNLIFLPFDLLGNDTVPDLGDRFCISMSPVLAVSIEKMEARRNFSEKVLAFGSSVYNRTKKGNNRGLYPYSVLNPKTDDARIFKRLAKSEIAGEYFNANGINWYNLPGTKAEIRNVIAKVFSPNVTFVEEFNASEKTLKDFSKNNNLKQYSILHFACNAYFDNIYPEMTSLVFSEVSNAFPSDNEDGYLTLEEIASLNINSDFAMISAGQTESENIVNEKSVLGLAQSFFLAGSNKVALSLWNVDDEALCFFCEKLYKKIKPQLDSKRGINWGKAFQEAKAELKKEKDWISPYYWSAFILFE